MSQRSSEQIATAIYSDRLFREAYGRDWARINRVNPTFQRHYGYEKAKRVIYWEWSTTFGRWGALVSFSDGMKLFTYPKYNNEPGFNLETLMTMEEAAN